MIPVLACPVISRFELLEAMLATIDYPIGRIVVVDNSLTGWTSAHDELPISYLRPIGPLGYPGGINAVIAQTSDAPWWAWANADLVFGPGDLAHIASVMGGVTGPRHVTGSHRGLRNAYGAMNAACVEAVGLFDEWAFYPIYFDDDDFERRCHLARVEWIRYDGGIRHAGSATIADPTFAVANGRTFRMNRANYIAKWGGTTGEETFATPYGLPVPLSFTKPDPAGRAARLW